MVLVRVRLRIVSFSNGLMTRRRTFTCVNRCERPRLAIAVLAEVGRPTQVSWSNLCLAAVPTIRRLMGRLVSPMCLLGRVVDLAAALWQLALGGCDRTHEPQVANCVRSISPMRAMPPSQPRSGLSSCTLKRSRATGRGHALVHFGANRSGSGCHHCDDVFWRLSREVESV